MAQQLTDDYAVNLYKFLNADLLFAEINQTANTAAAAADFFKAQYLKRRLSFSFEMVFPHPAKIEILKQTQAAVFRTYMYFAAAESSKINLNRIRSRVKLGGYDVPEDKTVARYYRCLEQVKYALPYMSLVENLKIQSPADPEGSAGLILIVSLSCNRDI